MTRMIPFRGGGGGGRGEGGVGLVCDIRCFVVCTEIAAWPPYV